MNNIDKQEKIILGVTGASGAAYAAELMSRCGDELSLIPTRWGRRVFEEETGRSLEDAAAGRTIYDDDDLFSPPASGSNGFSALVILPCSVSTLGKIASGIGDTLLTRTAAVALKERRSLVLCLRETPLSAIALRSALTLAEAGAIIFPLSPPFYTKPESIDEMVKQVVQRLLALLGRPSPGGWRSGELP